MMPSRMHHRLSSARKQLAYIRWQSNVFRISVDVDIALRSGFAGFLCSGIPFQGTANIEAQSDYGEHDCVEHRAIGGIEWAIDKNSIRRSLSRALDRRRPAFQLEEFLFRRAVDFALPVSLFRSRSTESISSCAKAAPAATRLPMTRALTAAPISPLSLLPPSVSHRYCGSW
jgi:hypothetical protein